MKNRILVPLLSVTCLSVMLFSCSSSRYSSYQKKSPGYSLNKQFNDKKNPQNIFNGAGEMPEEKTEAVVVNEISVSPAVAVSTVEITAGTEVTAPAKTAEVAVIKNAAVADNTSALSRKEEMVRKKMFKAIVKNAVKAENNGTQVKKDVPLLVEVILAIFIPPLAVLLHKEALTGGFFLNIILTILFWLPGIIHAMLIVFDVV